MYSCSMDTTLGGTSVKARQTGRCRDGSWRIVAWQKVGGSLGTEIRFGSAPQRLLAMRSGALCPPRCGDSMHIRRENNPGFRQQKQNGTNSFTSETSAAWAAGQNYFFALFSAFSIFLMNFFGSLSKS